MIRIISDLHLNPEKPWLLEYFLNFSSILQNGDSLYILGDLFEYWLGDDAAEYLGYKDVEEKLANLSNHGVNIFVMHGNRDFLIGNNFAKRCGLELITGNYIRLPHAQQISLSHGDSLCTDDITHQQFKLIVSNPLWQTDFLSKSIIQRDELARAVRYQSKNNTTNKAPEIMDVTPSAVVEALNTTNTNVLIHGHTHRPGIHTINQENGLIKYRVVLGCWDNGESFINVNENNLELFYENKSYTLNFRDIH